MLAYKLYDYYTKLLNLFPFLLVLQYFLIFICYIIILALRDKYRIQLNKISIYDWVILFIFTILFFTLGNFLDSNNILNAYQSKLAIMFAIIINIVITPLLTLLIVIFGKNEKILNIAKKLLHLFCCYVFLAQISILLVEILSFMR